MIPILLLLLYVVPRYIFYSWYNALPGFTNYYLEMAYCLLCFAVYRSDLQWRFPLHRRNLFVFIAQIAAGTVVFAAIQAMLLPVPWDMHDPIIPLFLIFAGPILEECLFRQALWSSLTRILRRDSWVVLASTALFSLGHAMAWFVIPVEYRGFLLFQVIYTALIGFWWGWERVRSGSLAFVILLHIAFNFGFWFAAQLLNG